MEGSVILTGANSSLGLHAVEHLLAKYSQYTAILTVRDASDADTNTRRLRGVISQHPGAKAPVHQLDLSGLSATHAFADAVTRGISRGEYPPLVAVICNAYYWNLVGDPELTADGYDTTMQVNHISHAALVLRLLGSFGDGGRIILLSSDSHWPGKNPMEKYPPFIPDDLQLLVNPNAAGHDKKGRGYQRYATSKLAITAWTHALNRYLQKDPSLHNLKAIAINPGNMVDSRALQFNTPQSMHILQRFVYKPLLPLFQLKDATVRTAAPGGVDVIEVSISPTYAGESGFFTLRKDRSSPESNDEAKQQRLWAQTLSWANITRENTALQAGFD